MKIALAFVALTSCAHMDVVADSTLFVWRNVLQAPETCPAPHVELEFPSTCEEGWVEALTCQAGAYRPATNSIEVVAKAGQRIHETRLVHELIHAYEYCVFGDSSHRGAYWHYIEAVTNDLLRMRGQ